MIYHEIVRLPDFPREWFFNPLAILQDIHKIFAFYFRFGKQDFHIYIPKVVFAHLFYITYTYIRYIINFILL